MDHLGHGNLYPYGGKKGDGGSQISLTSKGVSTADTITTTDSPLKIVPFIVSLSRSQTVINLFLDLMTDCMRA